MTTCNDKALLKVNETNTFNTCQYFGVFEYFFQILYNLPHMSVNI